MMKKLNKVDRQPLTQVPTHRKLSADEFLSVYEEGMLVIDTRNKTDFAKGHLPNTINIQGNNSFANWMGWIVNYDQPFVLIADENEEEDLTRKLMRIGLDNIYGFFSGITGLADDLIEANVIDIQQFEREIAKPGIQVVDVRSEKEYADGHVEGAIHAFVGTLENNLAKLDKSKGTVLYCQAGDRATIAYSIFKKHGFKQVKNYAGGMKAWTAENKPTISSVMITA